MKILYYTQTGTAEDFARRLGDDCDNYGFNSEVIEVETLEGEQETLAEAPLIIFFASTYGEGDAPDNAVAFHEWLMDKERESTLFANVKYAVFGLGNKTYPEYNVIGKQIDKRMAELGATRIYDLGLGNDDDNIEDDFLVWKKGFAPVVCKEFGLDPPGDISHQKMNFKQRIVILKPDDVKLRSLAPGDIDKIPRWRVQKKVAPADRNTPYLASFVQKRELHKVGSDRSCLHLEVSTHKDILAYTTGDHIGVYPCNQENMVKDLASVLKLDLDQIISIHSVDDRNDNKPIVGPCTIRALLSQYFDITFYVKKQLLRVLAQFAQDPVQQATLFRLASDEPGNVEYENHIVKANRTIYEVLKEFDSVDVPLQHFLEHLPKLNPRYYSISSSPNEHKDTVHITAVVTNWETPTERFAQGVTTTWFSQLDLTSPCVAPSFIRKSPFKPPTNLSIPLIMVGPGTGLAPFRGFLQEIKYRRGLPQNKGVPCGEVDLFFGCRTEDDFLYGDELRAYEKEGVISNLQVAFSRVTKEKVYVQHLMRKPEQRQRIWALLSKGAYFYVCGDARMMARDVGETVEEIIAEEGKMSMPDAKKYVEKMIAEGRHQSDVWS